MDNDRANEITEMATLTATAAKQQRDRSRARARILAFVAGLALFVAIVGLAAGRSLIWRSIGFVSVGIVAPAAMALSVRTSGDANEESKVDRNRVLAVMAFNVICIGIAAVHAGYIARRLW